MLQWNSTVRSKTHSSQNAVWVCSNWKPDISGTYRGSGRSCAPVGWGNNSPQWPLSSLTGRTLWTCTGPGTAPSPLSWSDRKRGQRHRGRGRERWVGWRFIGDLLLLAAPFSHTLSHGPELARLFFQWAPSVQTQLWNTQEHREEVSSRCCGRGSRGVCVCVRRVTDFCIWSKVPSIPDLLM